MKKRILPAVAAVLGIIMVFASASAAFADTYYNVRDDRIELYMPESWDVEEYNEEEVLPEKFSYILDAYDSDTGMSLRMYYVYEEADEYIYLGSSEDEVMSYYDDYGKSTVERLCREERAYENAVTSQPEFFDGEWNSFAVVDADLDNDGTWDEKIYLTACMSEDSEYLVHSILEFGSADGSGLTAQDKEQAESIANKFFDYDYYNIICSAQSDDSDDVWDIAGVIMTLFPAVIFIMTVAAAVNKRRKSRGTKRSSSPAKNASAKPEKRSGGTAKKAPLKPEKRRTPMKKTSGYSQDAEERYIKSLETLRKSGLLTRSEMQEMIDRHRKI